MLRGILGILDRRPTHPFLLKIKCHSSLLNKNLWVFQLIICHNFSKGNQAHGPEYKNGGDGSQTATSRTGFVDAFVATNATTLAASQPMTKQYIALHALSFPALIPSSSGKDKKTLTLNHYHMRLPSHVHYINTV